MKHMIAAVRTPEEFAFALQTKVEVLFMLATNLKEVSGQIKDAHDAGKKIFVHIDLAEGIGKDEYGLRYLKEQGADGVISTRTNLIKMAKKNDIFTVQRFFVVDSHSLDTTIESAKVSKADMIEIMPGTLGKVISRIKKELDIPVVVGGLIETEEEIREALGWGATAISTGEKKYWGKM